MDSQAHFERGLALFNDGEFKRALVELNQALDLAPEQAKYRILRAQTYFEINQPTQAIQDLQAVIQQGEQVAEAYFQLGCGYYSEHDWKEAVLQFTQAIRYDSEMVEAYKRRAQAYWFLKEYEVAIQDYNAVLQRQPHDGLSYINRGRARYALGDQLPAMGDFAQGLYYQSGMDMLILWSRAEWRVIPELEAVITQAPDNADAYFVRGHAYETQMKPLLAEAIRDYSHAIELSPERPVFYLFRSRAYWIQGNLDTALKDIEYVLTCDPMHVDALILRGKIHYRQGNKHQAVMDWEEALKQSPNHLEAAEIREMMKE